MSEELRTSALLGMAENFGATMTTNLLNMWLGLLSKYTDEEVAAACVHVIENFQYKGLPPFAELKKYLPDGSPEEEFAGMSKAELLEAEAANRWCDVVRCMEERGRNYEPHFDETTEYVLNQMGGYYKACSWKEDSMPFKEKEFKQLWKLQHGKVSAIKASPAASIEQSAPVQALPPAEANALPAPKLPDPKPEKVRRPFPCTFCQNHGYYNAARDGQTVKFNCVCQTRNGIPHSQCRTGVKLQKEGWQILQYDDGLAYVDPENTSARCRNRLYNTCLASSAASIQESAEKLTEAVKFNPRDCLNNAVINSAF